MKDSMSSSTPTSKPERDWEAEDGADTLMKAEDIKAKPDLMGRIHKHLQKKHAQGKSVIKSIQDLKDAGKSMDAKGEVWGDEDTAQTWPSSGKTGGAKKNADGESGYGLDG